MVVQPAKVYPVLVNPFVAIAALWSYVAVVFAVLPPVAPFPLYATVYVFAVNVAVIVVAAVVVPLATDHLLNE